MKHEFSGALSERLEVLRAGATDVAGAAAEAVSVGEVWAEVLPQRERVDVRGERLAGAARWQVRMRAEAAPEVGDVLVWRVSRLRVLAVTRDPKVRDQVNLLAEMAA